MRSIREEIIDELNKQQPHDLEGEIEVFLGVVRKRMDYLLKEIEKIQKSIESPDLYGEGLFGGLTIAKEKIKKAFEGVME